MEWAKLEPKLKLGWIIHEYVKRDPNEGASNPADLNLETSPLKCFQKELSYLSITWIQSSTMKIKELWTIFLIAEGKCKGNSKKVAFKLS